MAEDSDDKTEEPTSKRLEQAREKGDVPQSTEVRSWASLAAGLIIIGMLAPKLGRDIKAAVLPLIDHPHAFTVDADSLPPLLFDLSIKVLIALAWPLLTVIVVTVVAMVAQTGGLMWVPTKLTPDFNRLNPLAGLKRQFSVNQLIELGKQLLKLAVVGGLMLWMVWPRFPEYQELASLDLPGILAYLSDQVYSLVLLVVVLVTILTVGDFLLQRWRFMEKMRMSKQEVRDEHKQQEGDPMVKGRLRSLRVKRARQRMMSAVPAADVVVTNPTHFAVALKYDMETMAAPVLVAKGADLIAKRIREIAEENEVPVVENPPLARALFATVELDQEVPQEHYKAVAEVIGYVMRLKGQLAH
ncbi:MAG: flagellar biosynthesis protein FlhB [Magnetospirillum sp.]|nr:flagellar biosynthesis protein FlhB [Magnetospirillum sp.]